MNNKNEEINREQGSNSFEESIQKQIEEHEQNPSVLLNGEEFLERLSANVKKPEQELSPLTIQVPQKTFNNEVRDQLVKQLRLKFEILRQQEKGKKQDREK